MNLDYQKIMPYIIKFGVFAIILLCLYYIGIPLVEMLLPFIIAALISMIIEPQVKFMESKFKFSRKISSLIALLIFLAIFGTVLTLLIYRSVIELASLSAEVPNYFKLLDISNEMSYWSNLSQRFYLSIPTDAALLIQDKLNESLNSLSMYATSFVTSLLSFVLDVVKILPESFIFIIITIISTYFISSDKRLIREFIFNQLPESWKPKIIGIKSDLIYAFIGFIKAQIILIVISITIASTGLSILGVKYAIIMGIIIGMAELIPVVGTGSIFVPWIIIMLISGNTPVAIGLLGIFILGVITRQILEPKIIGVQVGIYPLVALISIYVGLRLFGVFGMILGPIIVILIKSLNKSNIIKLWKD